MFEMLFIGDLSDVLPQIVFTNVKKTLAKDKVGIKIWKMRITRNFVKINEPRT